MSTEQEKEQEKATQATDAGTSDGKVRAKKRKASSRLGGHMEGGGGGGGGVFFQGINQPVEPPETIPFFCWTRLSDT